MRTSLLATWAAALIGALTLAHTELPAGSTALQTDPAAAARVRFADARPAR